MSTSARLIEVLKNVAETDEVERNLDLPLYDSQVLDSMKTVDLIVAGKSSHFDPDVVDAFLSVSASFEAVSSENLSAG